MIDFGGDASNGKCQVRDLKGDCPNSAQYRIEHNVYTARDVCVGCLGEAIDFIVDQIGGPVKVVSKLRR